MAEPKLPHDFLRSFMSDVLQAVKVPKDDADVCADVLIKADLLKRVMYSGMNRLKPIYVDRINKKILNPETQMEIVRDTAAVAVVDGHNGMGMVIGKKCMQMAIDKAKKYGIGMVTVRNSTHFGIAGYYALMAAEQVWLQCSSISRPNIWYVITITILMPGVENMLGTNPLTFAFPTDHFPFLLDCATSIIQRGKVEKYARENKHIHEGCVINEDGESLTDCNEILALLQKDKAAFLAVGGVGEDTAGYKGYGYATVVELLSTCLQQVAADQKTPKPIELGHFFIAMNVEAFCDMEDFKKEAGDILRELRNSKKAKDAPRIYTAGEKEHESEVLRLKEGVPVPVPMQKELDLLRSTYKLTQYSFPWDK